MTIDDDSTSKAKWMGRKSKLCEDGISDDKIAGNFNAGYHFTQNSSLKFSI